MTQRSACGHRDQVAGQRDAFLVVSVRSCGQLIVAAGLLAAQTPSPASAQEIELEEIVVTGSRIARPDFESASPVVTIPESRFEQTAAVTVENVLNSMPQFVGRYGSATNTFEMNGRALLSLRGLPETATLVLLDGRRMIPSTGTGVPDVNLIPPSLVERVEVLTGGASAVYGSDAMAGVVNFRLKQRFDGLEFGGSWGQTDRGDGQSYTATMTGGAGFADGRGSVMASVEYSERDLVKMADREFSRVVLRYYGPGTDGVGPGGQFLPGGSRVIEEGIATFLPSPEAFEALFERYGYPAGTVPFQREFGFNSDGTIFALGNDEPGSVANFRGIEDPLTFNDGFYTYNYAPPNALQLPLERTTVFLNGSLEFSESVELYAQGLYGDYSVSQRYAPTPVWPVYFPPTNPYVPADLKFLLDSRSDPDARVTFSKRTLELGPRVEENQYDVYQVALGVQGALTPNWDYDAYAQFGRSTLRAYRTGHLSMSRFEELLYAPDGGQSVCGGLDPFGLDSMSTECAAYLAVDVTDRQETQQFTSEFALSGAPFDLPAGPVETVLGLFFKEDRYSLQPDELTSVFLPDGRTEVSGAAAYEAIDADDHNLDVYVEALLPITRDVPGAHSVQAVVGYRHSEYASAGGAESYKMELQYEPVDAVHLRGSYQRAVRAPSIYELYSPQVPYFANIYPGDPCNVDSAQRTGPDADAVEALCLAQGMSPELLDVFSYQDYIVGSYSGGNPDLQPEDAETVTVGIVLDSMFAHTALDGLRLSLDWYNIHITEAIATLPAYLFIPQCYDPVYNPEFDPGNRYCSYFARDSDTGVIFDAYEISRNIAGIETSGIDLQLDWRMPAGAGEVAATWLVSWVDTFRFQQEPKVEGEEWVNTGCCPTLPEWKWNLVVSYTVRGFVAEAAWQYLGGVQDFVFRELDVPSKQYLDLTAAYEFDTGKLDGLRLRAGVTNVLDEDPPIFAYSMANTDPAVFDTLGRRYFISVNYALRGL